MRQLRVRTLGEQRLLLDDEPIAPLPAKVAGLVVYLAETGEARSRSALAGLMWSDLPEQTARANLRQALTRLRKELPEHVEVGRDVVALKGSVWIDTHELSREHGARVAELYRGDFLSGFDAPGATLFDEWVGARRAIHRTTAIASLEGAAAAALEGGHHHEGIVAARRILEIEPFNEAAHSALMRLFESAGQPAAALAQFETCRHVLAEELGTTPAADTRRLAAEIRRSPDAREGLKPPAHVGSPSTSFVGREPDLQRIRELLDNPDCRVLSLVGPGGVGKTRLALELIARMLEDDRDASVVELSGLVAKTAEQAADLVVTAIARTLGLRLQDQRDPLELLIYRLMDRRLVLVLDNFEHLPAAATVVAALAARLQKVRLLITTRQRLGLGSEWVLEVSGLDYPPVEGGGDLDSWPAVKLFVDRLRSTPDSAGPFDLDAIVRITRLVEGLPLALELAATRARSVPADEVARRLSMDLGILESAAADVPARHRSMRSVLDWSWSLLSRDAQQVLASCSVFRGRFSLDAVDAVADGPSLAAIDELVAHSLVTSEHRFGLHELVRSYASNRLVENPQLESAARGRHARHFARRLKTGWDMEDFEDLRSATGWLIEHDDADSLGDHLQRLWVAYRAIGAYAEARDVFEAALERADASQLNRSRWHECAGQAHLQMGRLEESHHHLADSLRTLGAPFPRNRSAIMLKLSSQIARQLAHRVLPWPTRSGDAQRRKAAVARAERLNLLGETFYLSGDPMPVGVAAIWALNESEVSGERELARIGRAETALMWSAIGWHRAARRYAEEATRGETSGLDQERLAFCHMVTMVTWLGLGEWARVESNGARALEGASRSPKLRIHEQADLLIAVADNLRGRFVEAHDRGQEVVTNARRRGSLETQMWGHLVLAEAACRLDWLESARESGLRAADLVAQTHDRGGDRARAESILARVAFAREHFEESVGRLLALDSIMGSKPVFYPWAMEAHTAPLEITLDLIEMDYLDKAAAASLMKRGGALASAYARVFPIARPRVALLEGRVAALDGHRRRARRVWLKGLRLAERLEADWDAAQIRRNLEGASAEKATADTRP